MLRALANRLADGDVHAVAPRPRVDLGLCSRLVGAYYNIRARLPCCCEGIGGSGVYALSEFGRSRFREFPEITADDGFVRIQFRPEERETLASFSSTVFPPRTIKNLLAIRTRAYLGNFELSKRYPDLWKNRGLSNNRAIIGLLWSYSLWPGLAVYLGVNIIARGKSKLRLRRKSIIWERDNTSRIALEKEYKCFLADEAKM